MFQMPFTIAEGLLPNFLTPEGQVLAWSLVVFVVLLGLLWKFAFGPIMHALEERESRIQGTIDEAARKLKESEARVAEYEKKMNAAKDEAAAIIAQGKRDVDALNAEERAKARQEIEADKERAKREIGLAKDAAVAELRERVVKLTGDIVTKVMRREVRTEDHRAIIDQTFKEMERN